MGQAMKAVGFTGVAVRTTPLRGRAKTCSETVIETFCAVSPGAASRAGCSSPRRASLHAVAKPRRRQKPARLRITLGRSCAFDPHSAGRKRRCTGAVFSETASPRKYSMDLRSHPVPQPRRTFVLGAMDAAEKALAILNPVTDDADSAMAAGRRHGVNGAFEAVEGMCLSLHRNLKCLVVVVAASFACGHGILPLAAEALEISSFQARPFHGGSSCQRAYSWA
jgi:hypothetical protein